MILMNKKKQNLPDQKTEALKKCGKKNGINAFIDVENSSTKSIDKEGPSTIIPHGIEEGCPYCGALPEERMYDFSIKAPIRKRIIKVYPCSCHASEAAAMEKKRSYERRIEASGIPPRYMKATFNLPGKSGSDEWIISICKRYINRLLEGQGKRGLGLIGKVGIGKTYYMCAILLELINRGKQCLFINMPEFYHHLKSTFVPDGTKDYAGLIIQVKQVNILGIDEIGQRKLSDWAQEELYGIINYRYNYDLPTLFTTSKALSDHAYLISPDITDRLYEMCEAYEIQGQSRRKIQRQGEI